MLTLNLGIRLNGRVFSISQADAYNLSEVIAFISEDDACTFTVHYNGEEYTGEAERVGSEIVISFDESVILPSDMCVLLDCEEDAEEDVCYDHELDPAESTRIAVLDDDGCLKGYITLEDIVPDNEYPDGLCDLLGVEEIPQGNLVASDRILLVDTNCELKAVPIHDITCDLI